MNIKVKTQDIQDDLDMGSYNGFNGTAEIIEKFGAVELETPMGEKVLVKSEAELMKFFNVQ